MISYVECAYEVNKKNSYFKLKRRIHPFVGLSCFNTSISQIFRFKDSYVALSLFTTKAISFLSSLDTYCFIQETGEEKLKQDFPEWQTQKQGCHDSSFYVIP